MTFLLELLYGIRPHILDIIDPLLLPPVSIFTKLLHEASDRVNLMLRKQPRDVSSHDLVPHHASYFRRDREGWLGLAIILGTSKHKVIISHNGQRKISSFSQVKKISIDRNITTDSNDDTPTLLDSTTTYTAWTATPAKSSASSAYSVSRRRALSLQAEANRIINGPATNSMDTTGVPASPEIST